MEKIHIKLADFEDFPAIEAAGDSLFDYKIKTQRTIEFLKDPRHHLVLAYHTDQIVGMASGVHYVHPDKDPSLFVNEVSVLGQHQNKGIGRNLVRFLCDHGKTLGCVEAWVATEKSNIAAQKAYLAAGGIAEKEAIVMFGFKTDGERP